MVWLMFLFLGNGVLWVELADEIYSTFKKQFDWWYADAYLKTPYSSNFPKDPFIESFEDIQDMSRQKKIAWTEYIEKILAEHGCSLHKKKIWSILYYFVPEFRSELTQTLKVWLGDYSSKIYTFDTDKIMKYCGEYYVCVNWKDLKNSDKVVDACKSEKDTFDECSTKCHEKCEQKKKEKQSDCFNSCYWRLITDSCLRQRYNYDKCVKSQKSSLKSSIITADSAANVETNCKEFFEENYKMWKDSEEKKQNLQVSQVAFDKYWNATTDDSPYDIMSDFWSVWRLLYTDAEQPITPVLYSLPMFSNSVNSLKNHKEDWSSYDGWWMAVSNGNVGNYSPWNGWWNIWVWWQLGSSWTPWSSSDPIPLQLPRDIWWLSMEDGYEDLIEWLWAFSLKETNSQIYGSLCEESEEEPEQETQTYDKYDGTLDLAIDLSDYSDEELKELIGYMKSAVDEYASLPDDKKQEMKKRGWDTSNIIESDLERTANKIKNCWKWCDGLRIDQYASCLIMCTCGEIKSSDDPINLFDPKKFPWLWPIFVIKFCAVPATNTKFSKWWKKIVSIEEWIKEIYGALDKLSREWRLWIWTQEYNFLDSSTKKMNISDTVAFSIDIEFVDIADKYSNQSEQYLKKQMKNSNMAWQKAYFISHDLEDPVSKNYNGIMAAKEKKTKDISTQANAERTQESKTNVAVESSSVVDLNSDSRASHYNEKSQLLDKWLNQQGDLWVENLKYIEDSLDRAKKLSSKKKLP